MTQKLQSGRGRGGKRQVIIETTVDLFRRTHDVRKVSVEDIAAAAKVSPTTIYNQFGSREALVLAAAKSVIAEIGRMAEGFIKSDLPFDQKLASIVAGKITIASAASDEVIAKMLSQDRDIAPFIEELFRNVAWPMWRDFLAEGKAQGYINESLDAEVFLEYLDVLRAGFAAKKELIQNWMQNMDKLKQMTRLAFYGFVKKDIDLFGEVSNTPSGSR
ncbi:DNA-binding transcriptional regulator, AcrR family [Dehalogenimonas formicexedens]|uniref:DNA-binding transcriptional regulator, AcrR family n=1 Tax=Dehalogenimonas formicexedens TaxID=1839801 RepID=A0A1P8F955_9CHLR|nr:TetR/AcrR family transcriptional regulator [Dehalogenimonas formicexedens]APV44975.1 DNA-binding transcriptional regulator, AcrR family [Dehalogenimonas formicexedens]